ncbi:O-linked N-acetylglucosamine transferase, SPINDLY family protein [Anabaena sp. UHCC 0204]|uniref:O-linked N-acetylglucosamine transferase, SPINDLY family protein n=1 Tax=Anabaena sp. UHCC 0204 TaxID=2590009 RepID=UPI001447C29C|nr:O-linked N-acetylglucosamine transferase, SPINDLY family protein [Anabaena sp. UHCC 0204]MTJ10602.1 O-linked N-acetylglucosamine transferase, SPINDLY family protein [Anabaena sp. UHCC 0204]
MSLDASNTTNLQQQIKNYLCLGDYPQLENICEQAINANPSETSNYWYLGLALLLQGQEADAQFIWMTPILEAEDAEPYTAELLSILSAEAERQADILNYKNAWLIRRHIDEIILPDLNNLLQTVKLSVLAGEFSEEDSSLQQVIEILDQGNLAHDIPQNVLLDLIEKTLDCQPSSPLTIKFAEVCIPYIVDLLSLSQIFINKATVIDGSGQYKLAAEIAQFCTKIFPDDIKLMLRVVAFLELAGGDKTQEAINLAEKCLEKATLLPEKIIATHHILVSLMKPGGQWYKAHKIYQEHKGFLSSLFNTPGSIYLDLIYWLKLLPIGAFLLYFEDLPQTNRPLRNQIGNVGQAGLQSCFPEQVSRYQKRNSSVINHQKPLKIGYLSECFRRHSVGWLARWLLNYHDQNNFEIHLYSLHKSSDDYLQQDFIDKFGANFHQLPIDISQISEQIYNDQIDILVDLDSITSLVGCGILALKPAPIQVTWLGYDGSGMPAIDYFIGDPYVLPSDAQDYYTEKIWRLPDTYIAVDGFEVSTPNLRRDELDIPNNAIIYFSSQTGFKRHPDNVRLQMRILKEVPNSYFLIKGLNTDEQSIKTFFEQIAEEEGVNSDKLRFLPSAPSELIHRANLAISDVVLDTYPYNGATTTLETLWMGIPLVTHVGKQFAARNSYTMMMNVGVTEGITWSEDEYVEWGIRLGKDAELRQQISWKLRQSRTTSPLWNGKKFAREMENAYQQMWEKYIDSKK